MPISFGSVIAHLDDDPDVKVDLPRRTEYSRNVIPWYLTLDHTLMVSGPRAAMVAVRDALTAALDTHPDDSPAPDDGESP